MHLRYRNVNDAFMGVVSMLHTKGAGRPCGVVTSPSRNGSVLMFEEPVTVTYTHPRERVLFNAARDANPFFHLYESLWMLAGRNDVAPVAYYAGKMRDFSDDGGTLNGAYGYRWRKHETNGDKVKTGVGYYEQTDQLDALVAHLKATPDSRRAVLQMWNVEDDLLKIDASKDVCCNLSVMFSLRVEQRLLENGQGPVPISHLDMTVTNRSNDLVWGMLGANYVHFTVLQEYVAARLRAEVGRYHHFTNNLHVYDWNWKPEAWLGWDGKLSGGGDYSFTMGTVPLVRDPAVFERELPVFVKQFDGSAEASVPGRDSPSNYTEPFLREVAQPMLMAFQAYKRKERDVESMLVSLEWAKTIKADDWRVAAVEWLQRRVKA